MKYFNKNSFELTPGAATRYLESLGITNVNSFLYGPVDTDYESPWNLHNIRSLVDGLHWAFTSNKKFFLQVDSDCDGITSSAIFYNYFKELYPNAYIDYRIHDGKEHGVILNTVPVWSDVIIIPDAGSNQTDEQYTLSENGRHVFIMDHHIVKDLNDNIPNVVIVNNQTSPQFKNKSLSGAGVVYKVIQAYDEAYGGNTGLYKKFEDLAALGIIADCMDTRDLDNNAIIRNGLKYINNKMFLALLKQQSFKVGDRIPNKTDIGFYIAPLINAVIRAGDINEKTEFFKGFITPNSEEIITTVWRGETRYETYYEFLARTAYNLRNRQNTQKEKSIQTICDRVEAEHLDDNRIILVKINAADVSPTITGLVAMDVQKQYNKPTLVLRPVLDNERIYYRGSGRASEAENFDSFMNVLLESGVMDYVEGHDNAFGASILEDNIPALLSYVNDRLANIDFGSFNPVDAVVTDGNWNSGVLREFANIADTFGQGMEQPKFYFKFQVPPSEFRVQGSRQDSLKIGYKNVSFVCFQNKEIVAQYWEMYEKSLKTKEELQVECIGKAVINEYQGYRNLNVMIESIELNLVPQKSKKLF